MTSRDSYLSESVRIPAEYLLVRQLLKELHAFYGTSGTSQESSAPNVVLELTPYLGGPDLGPETVCPLSEMFSVSSFLQANDATITSFHIHSNSSFTSHPFIRRYMV
jgi:hypothetical protein